MSDINISGIPNMGFAGGGGGYFGGIPNVAPAWSAADINRSIWGNYSPGMAQQTQNNIYGAGGFGGLTDYYTALSAMYGRASTNTPYPGAGNPSGQVTRGADLPAPDTSGYDPLGGGSPAGYNPFDSSTYGLLLGGRGQPQPQPQASRGGGIGSDTARDPYAWLYATSSPYATPQHAPSTSNMPNLGYNPGMGNLFAPQMSLNAYAPLYGAMQYPSSGTPSQYWGTNGAMPPSFQRPFSFDQPGGALPMGGGGGPGVYQNDPFGGLTGAGG